MKKTSTLIGAFSLSLLTVGAIAQTKSIPFTKLHLVPNKLIAREMPVLNSHKAIKHNTTSLTTFELDYGATDQSCVGSANYYYWSGGNPLNAGYTAADSGAAGTTKNYNGLHSMTVAYDTIVDVNDFGYNAASGSVMVDTVFAVLGYRNTSGLNDTMVFTISNVSNAGYPQWTTIYSIDTVIAPPHSTSLPGNVVDSLYEIYIVPNQGLGTPIPSTAAYGSHFAVTLSALYNSKLDTLVLNMRSQAVNCSGVGDVEIRTCAGVEYGPEPNLNSFETGLQWYNTAAFGGNGSVLTWPLTDGYIGNSHGDFGDYWFTPDCNGDTAFLYFQDNWMLVTITYNNVTGINPINPVGLNVNQNYPNPFNQTTQIAYTLVKSSDVDFTICDMTGRVLTHNVYTSAAPGSHEINLSANSFAPGVYFYTLKVNGNQVTKKMVITE